MGNADAQPAFLPVVITPDPDHHAEARAQLHVMPAAALGRSHGLHQPQLARPNVLRSYQEK